MICCGSRRFVDPCKSLVKEKKKKRRKKTILTRGRRLNGDGSMGLVVVVALFITQVGDGSRGLVMVVGDSSTLVNW